MRLRTKQPAAAGKPAKGSPPPLFDPNKDLFSFSYVYSHDLQEPLRKIQTFSSHILEREQQNLSDNGKECLKRMQHAAKRMQMLIDDLVMFSKISTSQATWNIVKLGEVIEEVKDELKKKIEERKAVIQYSGVEEAPVIPFQFHMLLYNLLSNSLKFADPSRQLKITMQGAIAKGDKLNVKTLSPQKKYYHLNVSDNGIGFEQRFSERIFGLFQTLHDKDSYEGTGIGLALCKKIVENHNGLIVANGELNKGASFDIYIPLGSS